MKQHFFIEAIAPYQTEATLLLKELTTHLEIKTLTSLRVINVYHGYHLNHQEEVDRILESLYNPVAEINITEEITPTLLDDTPYLCIEPLPGQFNQRADSLQAIFSLQGLPPSIKISSSKLYLFNKGLNETDFKTIQAYLFNPIDSQIINPLTPPLHPIFEGDNLPKPLRTLTDFIHMTRSKLMDLSLAEGIAMDIEDLLFVQQYFKEIEKRNPTETELLLLDTYWSDHCRHTTFETALNNITFSNSQFAPLLKEAYSTYLTLRKETNREKKPQTLMDMGTIFGRYQRQTGELADMEVSDEVNACSVKVKVTIDGKEEPWLLMFKNETHNHPTEIEPFGGASTCVGGAIRDPLSGRAYVYQALRISGAGNVLEPVADTLPNKLPQRKISLQSAEGNSSYGNQIGATTAYVHEFYHEGFKAKHMELGAVVGAVPENQVIRKAPTPGDYILMLGARTGRDGVGGATGSSQEQTEDSLKEAGSEVQKGSPNEERKIVRLFRKPAVTRLIKKSNDFGAGGVSVAIGELADGVAIDLDVIPTKYQGLNGTELAISESQERMAVVIEAKDYEAFVALCHEESVEVVKVAEVTKEPRLRIHYQGEILVDISREFLNTNGVRKENEVKVVDSQLSSPLFSDYHGEDVEAKWVEMMGKYGIASQQGLQSRFDFSLGRSTVLAPYGGRYQLTQAESSVQKIRSLKGRSETASLIAHGYHPDLGEWSPFHGASYAVIESVARLVASGADWTTARLTFQEYFERLDGCPQKFGKPVAALLGSIQAQKMLNLPSIGGKDSMSGTFNDLNVPPTLVSFAVAASPIANILSPEFKRAGEYIYLLSVDEKNHHLINYDAIVKNFATVSTLHQEKKINAALSIKKGGIAEALAKMSFGNRIGFSLEEKALKAIGNQAFFRPQYGAFIITTSAPLPESDRYTFLGTTLSEYHGDYGSLRILGVTLENAYRGRFKGIYAYEKTEELEENRVPVSLLPTYKNEAVGITNSKEALEEQTKARVFIPVFAGTHSEYDLTEAFEEEGAKVVTLPLVTLTEEQLENSLERMAEEINRAHIVVLAGGFVSTDEPIYGDYITHWLKTPQIKTAIEEFLARDGLLLGQNAGMSALLTTGLLPFGHYEEGEPQLSLALNQGGRFYSGLLYSRLINRASPWTNDAEIGAVYSAPLASRYGRLIGSEKILNALISRGQVVSQWTNDEGEILSAKERKAKALEDCNPAGSLNNIEGLCSPTGHILGLISNGERVGKDLFKNIPTIKPQPFFKSAVNYVKKRGA